jgi:hypothetical protein
MEMLIFATLLSLIPAIIARNKGRNFVVWWIYGLLLFIIALPHSILIKSVEAEQSNIKIFGR